MKKKTVYSHEYQKIIEYLIQIRKESGKSQGEIANLLQLRQSDISKIESKDRRIDIVETFLWIEHCSKNSFVDLLRIYKIYLKANLEE